MYMCYLFYQFVCIWCMSIYMLCNYGHCSLWCIVTWACNFWPLSSLLYLWSIFLLCVTYAQLGASVLFLSPPPPVRLLKLWVGPVRHSQILAPPLDPEVGPWGTSSTSSYMWYGRDALQPQNQWVWMGLCCYQLFWETRVGTNAKFSFEYLLYIFDKYTNVQKMPSKFCYGL